MKMKGKENVQRAKSNVKPKVMMLHFLSLPPFPNATNGNDVMS